MTKTIQDPKQIIKHLKRVLSHLDNLWEKGEDCIHPDSGAIVSNDKYDALKHDLIVLLDKHSPNDPFLTKPSMANSSISGNNKIKHDPPLTSISKISSTEQDREGKLKKWMTDCLSKLNIKDKEIEKYFVTSWKHDGVAIGLYYKEGELVSAGLRPDDGINGQNVTEHAKYIKGIPQKLNIPITGSIRGEVECNKSVFEKINKDRKAKGEKTYANPRNFTAGSMGLDDPKQLTNRGLSFTGYSIENLDGYYKTETERAKWSNQKLGVPFVQVRTFKFENLSKMENMVDQLDYEVDGIVLSFNDLDEQKQLGQRGNSATGNPIGKIAWKFREQNVVVKVDNIEWQVGRTGRVTPVLEFDPVPLAGTMVSKCTAHNLGIVKRKGIAVGSHVRIEKSGKIIPKVISVIKKVKNMDIPTECPSCKQNLIEAVNPTDATMMDLVCNNKMCPAQNVGQLVYYLSVLGVKGLADNVVGQLVDNNVVSCPADFYDLRVSDLLKIGITQRTALLSIARIHMVYNPEKIKDDKELAKKTIEAIKNKKRIPLNTLIAALGISGASKGTGRALAGELKTLDNIIKCSKEDLIEIEDIGEKTADNLIEYFSQNKSNITKLTQHLDVEELQSGKLDGKTFVFTGKIVNGKDFWKKKVESLGGKIASSVSKSNDYVVIGTDAGAKEQKARDLLKNGAAIVLIEKVEDLEKLLS